jgi:DNA-binding PadR family transcriptional regulator
LVLLSLIAEQPRYGYDLIRLISDATGGVYRPSPGVVYPTLTMLEDLGHVRTEQDAEQRRLLAITPAGQSFLDAHAVSLAQLKQRMPGGRSPQVAAQIDAVRAAMEQLKRALRATLSSGPVDAQQLGKIVAAIDAATREVTGSAA